MGEGLGEVAQRLAAGTDLLGVEPHVVGVGSLGWSEPVLYEGVSRPLVLSLTSVKIPYMERRPRDRSEATEAVILKIDMMCRHLFHLVLIVIFLVSPNQNCALNRRSP